MVKDIDAKYKWMKPFQRQLFDDLRQEFGFKNLTDVGNFLGLNNPYHGAKLIFESQKPNHYLTKIVELKQKYNSRIAELEEALANINNFKDSIDSSLENLSSSLVSIKEIKDKLD